MSLKWMATESTVGLFRLVCKATSGQNEISWHGQQSYVMGMGMLDVFRNGVLQEPGEYVELSPTSIKFVTPLLEDDTIIIEYRPTEVNLGDLRIYGDTVDLQLAKDVAFNSIAFVTSTRKFYRYGAAGWEEFIIPFTTQNIGLLFSYEKVTLTDQTVQLKTLSIPVGTGNTLVFVDGKKVDFTEVDNKTIHLTNAITPGQVAEVVVANADGWRDCNSHDVEYVYNGEDIVEEKVTVGGKLVEHSRFEYTGENITREVIERNGKTIIKTYRYNSQGDVLGYAVVVQ